MLFILRSLDLGSQFLDSFRDTFRHCEYKCYFCGKKNVSSMKRTQRGISKSPLLYWKYLQANSKVDDNLVTIVVEHTAGEMDLSPR